MVCACKATGNEQFEAVFQIDLSSKDDVLRWKENFEKTSKTTLRVKKTVSSKVLYRVSFLDKENILYCNHPQIALRWTKHGQFQFNMFYIIILDMINDHELCLFQFLVT